MVAITASVNGSEDEAHVFCPACFWGEDVPAQDATQIATEHEATSEHTAAELDDQDFEVLAEAVRDERGY
jgi:hypothetical protein